MSEPPRPWPLAKTLQLKNSGDQRYESNDSYQLNELLM